MTNPHARITMLFLLSLSVARGLAAPSLQPGIDDLRRALPGLSGLIVQIDAPDASLAKALCHEHPALFLLLAENARVDALREEVRQASLGGQVTVLPKLDDQIPLVDGSAACVISSGSASGIAPAEIRRALGPRGVLLSHREGRWQSATLGVPETHDGWPQYFYDGAASDRSRDTAVGPSRGLQWMGGPHNHTTRENSIGRIGYRIDKGLLVTSTNQRLIARDVRSGLPVWERQDLSVDQGMRYAFLIDGTNDAVILYPTVAGDSELATHLVRLDLRTGADRDVLTESLRATPEGFSMAKADPWREGKEMRGRISQMQVRLGEGRLVQALNRDLCALDAASGRRLWTRQARQGMGWWHPLIDGRTLYVIEGERIKSASYTHWPMGVAETVVAFDLDTGTERWRAEPRLDDNLAIEAYNMAVYRGQVALAGPLNENARQRRRENVRMVVLDANSGQVLHRVNLGRGQGNITLGAGHSHIRVLGHGDNWWINQIALHAQVPIANPEDRGAWGLALHGLRPVQCTSWRATANYLIGGPSMVDVKKRTIHHTNASRTDCDIGGFPGEGLLFESSSGCLCKPFLNNEKAFHSRTSYLHPRGERLVRRDARAAAVDPRQNPDTEWPAYLRDSRRTATVTGGLGPAALREIWRRPGPEASRAHPMIRREWNGLYQVQGEVVTGVSVAEGVAVFAEIHGGAVVALDPATGRERWRRALDSRIDSQPTIHCGMVLVGTGLGKVYALNRDNGATIWEFDAAPSPDLLVANGTLESVWRCSGTVTVLDRGLFVSAGRHTDTDGGIRWYLLDPATGTPRHQGVFGGPIVESEDLKTFDATNDAREAGSEMPPVSDGEFLVYSGRRYRWKDGDWRDQSWEVPPPPTGVAEIRDPARRGYVRNFYSPVVLPGNPSTLMNGLRLAGGHQWSWSGTRGSQIAYRPGKDMFFTIGSGGPGEGRASDVPPVIHGWRRAANPYPRDVEERRMMAGCDQVWRIENADFRFAGYRCIAACDDRVLVAGTLENNPNARGRKPQHMLIEIDPADGRILQQHELPSSPVGGGISISGGRVFVACNDGSIVGFGR